MPIYNRNPLGAAIMAWETPKELQYRLEQEARNCLADELAPGWRADCCGGTYCPRWQRPCVAREDAIRAAKRSAAVQAGEAEGREKTE